MARPSLMRVINSINKVIIGTNLGMLAADYTKPKPTSPINSPINSSRNSPRSLKSKMKGGSNTSKTAKPNPKGGSKHSRSVRRNRSLTKSKMTGGGKTYTFTTNNTVTGEIHTCELIMQQPHMFMFGRKHYLYTLVIDRVTVVQSQTAKQFANSLSMSDNELSQFINNLNNITQATKDKAELLGLKKVITVLKMKHSQMIDETKSKKQRASQVIPFADSDSSYPNLNEVEPPTTLQELKRHELMRRSAAAAVAAAAAAHTTPATPDTPNPNPTPTHNTVLPIVPEERELGGGSKRRRSVRRKCKRGTTRCLRR